MLNLDKILVLKKIEKSIIFQNPDNESKFISEFNILKHLNKMMGSHNESFFNAKRQKIPRLFQELICAFQNQKECFMVFQYRPMTLCTMLDIIEFSEQMLK